MKPLTDVAIRKAAAGAERRRIRDAGMRSLFLVIEASGHKAFQMRFRRPNGKPARLTLGPYAMGEIIGEPQIGMPLTLAAARALAADIHRQRALGVDVIADRQADKVRQRVEITTRTVTGFAGCVETFVADHARKNIRAWRENARMLGLRYKSGAANAATEPEVIKGGLCDRWSDKAVTDIDQADIEAATIEARRIAIPGMPPRNKGRSEARARKLLTALSAFFDWLHTEGLVKNNPCRDVARPENGTSRDRTLDSNEVRWFWQAAEMERGLYGPLLKLLLLTGARLDEVSGMRRDELSDDGAVWNLPGSRTKNRRPHIVPLPPMARDLIKSLPRGGDFIFSTTGTSPVSGWSRMKKRLDKNMLDVARLEKPDVKIGAWRLHDLRRTFCTGCGELGIAPHVIELCVNHVSGSRAGIAGAYNRSVMLPERKAALERWASHVAGLVDGRPAKVITMRQW
jgi:integrase